MNVHVTMNVIVMIMNHQLTVVVIITIKGIIDSNIGVEFYSLSFHKKDY